LFASAPIQKFTLFSVTHRPEPTLREYFLLGGLANLAPELRESSWTQRVEALGLRWVAVGDTADWNNYSEVDAVLAIRSFSQHKFNHKPASKLYNAWKAEVPAILGCESAYQTERKSELNYLEAASVDDHS
jgi:hypothetical protein